MAGRIVRFFVIPLVLALFFGYIAATFFTNHARDYLPPELARPEYAKVDQSKPIDGQTRTVEIGGRVFKFPLKYIEVLDDKGTHQRGVLLKVIWPDMKSLFDLKNKGEYDQLWQSHQFGNINLSPASSHASVEQMAKNSRHYAKKYIANGSKYGLEEYTSYLVREDEPTDEDYLEKDSHGTIVTYISCREIPLKGFAKYYPVCNQQFVDDGLLYGISYNQANYFSDWRQQRQRAINFVDNFEVKTNNKPPGGQP